MRNKRIVYVSVIMQWDNATYSINGEEKNALFKDVLKLDVPELKEAIKRNVPLIQKKLSEINAIIDGIPETAGEFEVISKERKEVYKKELSLRLDNLLVPEYRVQKSKDYPEAL